MQRQQISPAHFPVMSMSPAVLLEGLLKEIEVHRKRHDAAEVSCCHSNSSTSGVKPESSSYSSSSVASAADNSDLSERKCRVMLKKVQKITTSLISHYLSPSQLMPESMKMISLACKLLTVILRADFCPHASAIFGYGDALHVTPPLLRILALLANPAARVEKALSASLHRNACALLQLLSGNSRTACVSLFNDAVMLLEDVLHIISSSRGDQMVQIKCFVQLTECARGSEASSVVAPLKLNATTCVEQRAVLQTTCQLLGAFLSSSTGHFNVSGLQSYATFTKLLFDGIRLQKRACGPI